MSWKFYTLAKTYDVDPIGLHIDGAALRGKNLAFFSITEGKVEKGGQLTSFILRVYIPFTSTADNLENYFVQILKSLAPTNLERGFMPIYGPQIYGYPTYIRRVDCTFPLDKRQNVIDKLKEIFGNEKRNCIK